MLEVVGNVQFVVEGYTRTRESVVDILEVLFDVLTVYGLVHFICGDVLEGKRFLDNCGFVGAPSLLNFSVSDDGLDSGV